MTDESETLEEWAARVAPTLSRLQWRKAERDAKRADDRSRWTIMEARALLAFRDGLVSEIRDAGWPQGDSDSLLGRLLDPPGRQAWLEERGLLDAGEGPYCTRTPFGDEVARVLRGEGRDNG
jgi:hypothetical protein